MTYMLPPSVTPLACPTSLAPWQAIAIVLAVGYCGIIAMTTLSLIRLIRNGRHGINYGGTTWSWQHSFHLLLLFGATIRVIYWTLWVAIISEKKDDPYSKSAFPIPQQVIFMLNVLPSWLFMSAFWLLLLSIANAYHARRIPELAQGLSGNGVALRYYRVLIAVNGFLYVMLFVLLLLDFILYPVEAGHGCPSTIDRGGDVLIEKCVLWIGDGLFVISGVVYVLYGFSMICRNLFHDGLAKVYHRLLFKVRLTSALVALMFLVRAVVAFLSSLSVNVIPYTWPVNFLYWLLTELCPLYLMWYLLRPSPVYDTHSVFMDPAKNHYQYTESARLVADDVGRRDSMGDVAHWNTAYGD